MGVRKTQKNANIHNIPRCSVCQSLESLPARIKCPKCISIKALFYNKRNPKRLVKWRKRNKLAIQLYDALTWLVDEKNKKLKQRRKLDFMFAKRENEKTKRWALLNPNKRKQIRKKAYAKAKELDYYTLWYSKNLYGYHADAHRLNLKLKKELQRSKK